LLIGLISIADIAELESYTWAFPPLVLVSAQPWEQCYWVCSRIRPAIWDRTQWPTIWFATCPFLHHSAIYRILFCFVIRVARPPSLVIYVSCQLLCSIIYVRNIIFIPDFDGHWSLFLRQEMNDVGIGIEILRVFELIFHIWLELAKGRLLAHDENHIPVTIFNEKVKLQEVVGLPPFHDSLGGHCCESL
jgi:hypothetical protein